MRGGYRFISAVLVASGALAGCHHVMPAATGLGASPLQARALPRTGDRTWGFDAKRYLSVQAPRAKLTQMPPVQGLMPVRVDLRAYCSPIADQEDLGSCTAFAAGKGLREGLQVLRGESRDALSPLYLYYETRRLRHATGLDTGATLTDTMTALRQSGIAPEGVWPYRVEFFTQRPPELAYQRAKAWTLTTGVQLAGLDDMRRALLRRQMVVFGMQLYSSIRQVGPDGMIPVPVTGDVPVGWHAIAVVGYDDRRRHLIIRNSFGTEWGDRGYGYLPYAYITPEQVLDIWTAS